MKTDKMKKVLIAMDYDPTAQKVAEVGFSMAKAMNAEVVLLHVMSDPVYYFSTGNPAMMGAAGYMEMEAQKKHSVDGIKNTSQKFLDKSKHHLGDKTIQTLVEEGDIAESIIKTAKETHADIIVIGSHSKKWLENILMGSVTEKVLHNTTIPLFIVPTKQKK